MGWDNKTFWEGLIENRGKGGKKKMVRGSAKLVILGGDRVHSGPRRPGRELLLETFAPHAPRDHVLPSGYCHSNVSDMDSNIVLKEGEVSSVTEVKHEKGIVTWKVSLNTFSSGVV